MMTMTTTMATHGRYACAPLLPFPNLYPHYFHASHAVRMMMYGFGDDECPMDETVDLVEVREEGGAGTGGGRKLHPPCPQCTAYILPMYRFQDVVIEYLREATLRAADVSAGALKAKVDEKDMLFSVRKVGGE